MSLGASTTDPTVADIIERLFVLWLTPPDAQDSQVRLGVDIDAVTTTIILGGFTIPEDEGLLRQGSVIELEQELVRVISYDETAGTIEVTRGEYGTVPSIHSTPLLMTLSPPYARAAVFEAVADNIIQLYPKLYTSANDNLVPVNGNVAGIEPLAVEVLEIWEGDFASTSDIHGRIVDFHPAVGGRAVITNYNVGAFWCRYRRRMGKPEAETDTLEELGLDERWVNIVMTGAAADLMAGKDISASQTEWVKSVLEAENIRVGTRMSISGGLRQYRKILLDDAAAEMNAEYDIKVEMSSPFGSYS